MRRVSTTTAQSRTGGPAEAASAAAPVSTGATAAPPADAAAAAAAPHDSKSDAGSDAATSLDQTTGSDSGSASAGVAPSDTLLSSSILLRRLAERQFTQQQVKKTVQHLLDTHAISHAQVAAAAAAAAAGATATPSGESVDATPPPLAAPLTRAAYEVMLSALQEVQDLDTFEQVWSRMHAQFATKGSGATAATSSASSSFHPSALMYLCRMSVLMAHRRLDQVEDTFRAWKRSSEATDALAASGSLPAAHRTTPPNLLAFHLMLRRHLLASDKTAGDDAAAAAEGDPECAAKCMRLLQELKAAGSGTNEFDGQDDDGEEGGGGAGPNPASGASFRPVHLTFHLLLQSLLPRAMRDLRHLTPLLLDMEHQTGLAPDWNTFALALQVCERAAEQARRVASMPVAAHASKGAAKAAERQRKEAAMHLQTAWAKGAQLFRSVQQYAEKTRKQAEQKRAAVIAKQKAAAAKADAAQQQQQPPLPPPVPSAASLIPAPLWFRYLSLALESREYDALFSTLTSMQRDAMLIPPPALVDPVLHACASVAATPAPPAPVFSPDLRMDDEDRAIALRDWTAKARAHQTLQQQALAATLQMLRCSATHARMEANAAARRNAAQRPPPPPPSSSDAAADAPAAPSAVAAAPTVAPTAAAVIPLAHYALAFEVLSRLGRVDEFEKLWKHFMAQTPPLPLAGAVTATATTAAAGAPAASPVVGGVTDAPASFSPLDDLVRSALRLDGAAVAEAASAQSDRAAAATAVAAVQVSATGGELAYVMCTFFAKRMDAAAAAAAGAAAAAPHADADAASPAAAAAPVAATPAAKPDANSALQPAAPAAETVTASASSSSPPAPVDLLPVLRLLSPSTRSALVASLLAGDRTDAFTHVFAAQKHLLPLDQQRGRAH